jgi:hypothetical protein
MLAPTMRRNERINVLHSVSQRPSSRVEPPGLMLEGRVHQRQITV